MNLIKYSVAFLIVLSMTLSADWLNEPFWDKGMAEVSLYEGKKLRYGALHDFTMDLITVRESFDEEKMVKANPAPGITLKPIMKQNMVLKYRTGIYEYRQMSTVFISRDVKQLEKLTTVSGEWCGNSSVTLVREGAYFNTFIQNYMDNQGVTTSKILDEKGHIFYDELIPFLRQHLSDLPKELTIIPSLLTNNPKLESAVPAELYVRRKGAKWIVSLKPFGENFIFEDSPARKLLEWNNGKGETLKLRKSLMIDYWNKHHKGGESYLN